MLGSIAAPKSGNHKMRATNIIWIASFTFGYLVFGCTDNMKGYKETVRSGVENLPWPKQIAAIYGESDNFITEYKFQSGPRQWNTEVYFGGRYRLTLQVDVEIDYSKRKIVKTTSAPKFYLWEIGSLKRENGRVIGADFSKQWVFSEEQWNKVVKADVDWSVVGVRINDVPIPGFSEYVKIWREPRIRAD